MAIGQGATIKVMTDDLLPVGKAAKALGQHRTTVYRWVEAGKIVAIKLGGILFIPKSEIQRVKSNQEAKPPLPADKKQE